MSLDDFKALLWAYGGNLGRGSGHTDQRLVGDLELFLLAASAFLSVDARVSTCVFNLVLEMASSFSATRLTKELETTEYDARRLGVLASIIRDELERRGLIDATAEWVLVESRLRQRTDRNARSEPLLPHLPSLPGRRDPLFLSWGFDYPGIVREPEKYLRKGYVARPASAG